MAIIPEIDKFCGRNMARMPRFLFVVKKNTLAGVALVVQQYQSLFVAVPIVWKICASSLLLVVWQGRIKT